MENIEFNTDIALPNLSCIMFWKSRDLTYQGLNSVFLNALGESVNTKDVIGKNDYDFPWHDSADQYRKTDLLVLEGASILNSRETRWHHKNGPQEFLINKIPLRDKNNSIIGILGIHYSIVNSNLVHNSNNVFEPNSLFDKIDIFKQNKKELANLITQNFDVTLSNKELECFSLWLSGYSIKESSLFLCLSPKTIEVYRSRIKEKLNVHHKYQLIDLSHANGTFNLILNLSQHIVNKNKK